MRRAFEELLAFGKRHARARGLKPGDVARAIAAVRRKDKEAAAQRAAQPPPKAQGG